jgi:RNase P subunit RPR2
MKRTLCPVCHAPAIRPPVIVTIDAEASAAWTCRECNATFVQELPDLCFAKAVLVVEEVEAQ